ncbi:MAG: ABC transporter ATP-binding protein [Candidatus Thermoplasmatota archaeon]
MSQHAVETRGLCRSFVTRGKRSGGSKAVEALRDVNITIEQGELFGVLGPNGAGKTTLIKILATLLLPSSGEAYVLGYDVKSQASSIRQRINMVSGGETSGYGLLTVRENLWMFSQLYGVPSKIAKETIEEMLVRMGLEDKAKEKVRTLSTGMRQKMNVIRGFMTDPSLIFLDEPTLGLDVNASRDVRSFIKGWVREEKERTILLTTHYMMEADQLCDRVAIIDNGMMLACDSPERLKGMVKKESVLVLEVRNLQGPEGLGAMRGVSSYIFTSKPDLTELKFIIEDESVVAEIVSAVTQRGGKIVALHKTEPTLEDVFVALVGRGLTNG